MSARRADEPSRRNHCARAKPTLTRRLRGRRPRTYRAARDFAGLPPRQTFEAGRAGQRRHRQSRAPGIAIWRRSFLSVTPHSNSACENPAVSAVYIATANGAHVQFALQAAAHGKHVICEKPLATTVDDCQADGGRLQEK